LSGNGKGTTPVTLTNIDPPAVPFPPAVGWPEGPNSSPGVPFIPFAPVGMIDPQGDVRTARTMLAFLKALVEALE
jgi:hypothetical protein